MGSILLIVFEVLAALSPAWVYHTGAPMLSSLTFADIDGDSTEELIATTYGTGANPYNEGIIHVIELDGNYAPGWPVVIYAGPIPSTPAITDFDGDGEMEIFVGSWYGTYMFRGDGTYELGWPLNYGAYYSPSAGNLDSDGLPEAVFPASNGRLYAFNGDGTILPWFPITVPHDYPGTPALGDIDGDGKLEIVCGINRGPVAPGRFELYAWNPENASLVPGFPVYLCGIIKSSPAIADLDGDGDLEIIVDAYDTTNYDSLYVIEGNGQVASGWPQAAPGSRLSSPAIGDLYPDVEGLEIAVGGGGTVSPPLNGELFIFSASGELLNSIELPVGSGVNSSPVIADIDGDDSLEILIKVQDEICAYNPDGSPVDGFPYPLSDSSHSGTNSPAPAVGDPDGDGYLEMAFASCFGEIHYFETDVPYDPELAPWPMYKHDIRNTSRYGAPSSPSVKEGSHGFDVHISVWPNPFRERVFFSIGFTGPLDLSVYNDAGILVYRNPRFEGVSSWDGRDIEGRELPCGVYLAVLRGGNFTRTITLVKQ